MGNDLARIVEQWGRPRVLVLGDAILDRYVWGDAERISQEAPVILLRADHREERLGGAASVASMLSVLEAEVTIAGVVGMDDAAERLKELLEEHHIEYDLLLTDASRPTTLKERYMGRAQQKHQQQMLRVDYESRAVISDPLSERLASGIESRLIDFDIVLISDYDKGVCAPVLLRRVIEACRDQRIKVLIDPIRGGDYSSRYRGATTLTPNRLEAGLAVGRRIEDIKSGLEAADELRRALSLDVGMVTMDRDGMVLADAQGRRRHFPVSQREVYDITGAGDMVLAVLGLALAAGADYPEAIVIANAAGGLEVERVGVATMTRGELIADLTKSSTTIKEKVLTAEQIVREVVRRRPDERVHLVHGSFDVIDAEMIRRLGGIRERADLVIALVRGDAAFARAGEEIRPPINEESSRARLAAALEAVDYVCLVDDLFSLGTLETLDAEESWDLDAMLEDLGSVSDSDSGRRIVRRPFAA